MRIDLEGARAQACQRLDDQREAVGDVIARTAVEPHLRAGLASNNAEGSLSVLVGRHGAMNPAGKVRWNIHATIIANDAHCTSFC
jgi:hypothetical protein